MSATFTEVPPTIGQLVTQRPARARVFEAFGLDYCCGGKKPLAQACQEKGISLDAVAAALEVSDQQPAPDLRDWSQASLTELADHIQQTHHQYMKNELPRLEYLTGRVAKAHGGHRPELAELRQTFLQLKDEMESHMAKEEQILFPLLRQMEATGARPDFHCGSLGSPIAVMLREHDDAGAALAHMRALTGNYVPPPEACNTYRAMLATLAEVEADMHQHVHKENNILFPRAIAMETRLGDA